MMERRSCRTLLFTLIAVLAVGGLLLGAQPASAQTCIQDVWQAHGNKQNLTCTAQDVTLSTATNIDIITGGSCDPVTHVCHCTSPGTVTFTADFRMDLTADTRYDVGFYIATDGDPNHDGALTGQCSATASTSANTTRTGNFINLDNPNNDPPPADQCGDITGPLNTAHNPLFVTAQVTTGCVAGPSGKLELPFCTTWRQPGSNEVCLGTGNGTTTNDAYPGSPSKCNCGVLVVDIIPETATIEVTKTANTPSVLESGGSATYTVSVQNKATNVSVTLDSLTDNKYGDITTMHAAGGGFQAVTATTCVKDNSTATCQVGDTAGSPGSGAIAPGATCSCTFTGTVPPGNVGGSFTDVVTGCGTDANGHTNLCDTGTANVPYTDVVSAPTLTKTAASTACQLDVTYNVVVNNTNPIDTLQLNTLTDDVYGNITTVHSAGGGFRQVVSTSCGQASGAGILPATIAASGNYSCSFVGRSTICNETIHDTVTGGTVDSDGATFTPSDDARVIITVTTP